MRRKTPPEIPVADIALDVRAVADRLGLHQNTVKRLPSADLPYYRIGARGDRRYRLGDVLAFLDARRVG